MRGLNLSENHLREHEARWFAVCTNYKREKIVQKRLEDKGIECYLPLQKVIRRSCRKTRTMELPLISRYVFTHIVKCEYVPVLETPDVAGFVHFSDNLIAIPEREITVLKRVVGEDVELEALSQCCFCEGDEVEIIAGGLTGLTGKLLEKENKHNFLVELCHIGYTLCLKIDPEMMRSVKHHPEPAAAAAKPVSTGFDQWGLAL
jgi:transcription antitermination factor NusG